MEKKRVIRAVGVFALFSNLTINSKPKGTRKWRRII